MRGKIVGLFVCVAVAFVVLLVLFMAFVLMPVQESVYDFEIRDFVNQTQEIVRVDVNMTDLPCRADDYGMKCTYNFVINNTGNKHLNMTLKATVAWSAMTVRIALLDFPEIAVDSTVSFVLDTRTNTTVSLIVFFPSAPVPHGNYRTEVIITIEEPVQIEKHLVIWVDTDA